VTGGADYSNIIASRTRILLSFANGQAGQVVLIMRTSLRHTYPACLCSGRWDGRSKWYSNIIASHIFCLSSLTRRQVLLKTAASHSTDWSVLADAGGPQRRDGVPGFPMHVLDNALKTCREVDKVIVLTDTADPDKRIVAACDAYRWLADPDLLLVNIDLGGTRAGVTSQSTESVSGSGASTTQQNVRIAGFSDAILRYIADRGDGSDQVASIDTINASYGIQHVSSSSGSGCVSVGRAQSTFVPTLALAVH
jgi:hypothetical protein